MDFRSLYRFASCLNLRGRDRAAACRRRARQLHLGSKHYLHPATKTAGSNNRRASLLVVKRLSRSVKAARSRIPKAMVDAKIKQAYAAQVAQNRRRSLPVDESEQQANLKRVQMMPTPPPSIAASNHLNTENGGSEPDSDSDIASSGPHSPRIGRSAVDPDVPHLHSASSRPPTPPSSYQSDEQDTCEYQPLSLHICACLSFNNCANMCFYSQ